MKLTFILLVAFAILSALCYLFFLRDALNHDDLD